MKSRQVASNTAEISCVWCQLALFVARVSLATQSLANSLSLKSLLSGGSFQNGFFPCNMAFHTLLSTELCRARRAGTHSVITLQLLKRSGFVLCHLRK